MKLSELLKKRDDLAEHQERLLRFIGEISNKPRVCSDHTAVYSPAIGKAVADAAAIELKQVETELSKVVEVICTLEKVAEGLLKD